MQKVTNELVAELCFVGSPSSIWNDCTGVRIRDACMLPSLPSQFPQKNLQVHRILLKFVSDFFQTKA